MIDQKTLLPRRITSAKKAAGEKSCQPRNWGGRELSPLHWSPGEMPSELVAQRKKREGKLALGSGEGRGFVRTNGKVLCLSFLRENREVNQKKEKKG